MNLMFYLFFVWKLDRDMIKAIEVMLLWETWKKLMKANNEYNDAILKYKWVKDLFDLIVSHNPL